MSLRRVLFLGIAGLGLYLVWRQAQAAQYPGVLVSTWADLTGSGTAADNGIEQAVQTITTGATDIVTNSTRGERNNNPGNIVYSPANNWQGQIGHDGRFVTFSSPEYGIRALGLLLTKYMSQGYNSVSSIINHWAPPNENDTAAYIADVSATTGISANAIVDQSAVPAIAQAIIKHENGRVIYTPQQLASGFSMAGYNVA